MPVLGATTHNSAEPAGPPRGARQRVTRLAPSPTGALHLGNARTFLINWAIARRSGWRVVLRIEDLDGPRMKPESITQTIDTLAWLGLDWDGEVTRQSADLTPYHLALGRLHQEGLLYPCTCTRKEIEQAQSAPHAEDGETRYPGTCRDRAQRHEHVTEHSDQPWVAEGSRSVAWRVQVPDELIGFADMFHGEQSLNVQEDVGDFVVATKQGVPAYQLAVVVDDARQGVTDVIRGADLLCSTPRQILLYRLLGLGPPPSYTHLPLVVGEDGRRLAKRHGDTRLTAYRASGVPAARIIGLLASWSGVTAPDERREMTAHEFAERFRLDALPREPIVFHTQDEQWLRGS